MRLTRIDPVGPERPVVLDGDEAPDASSVHMDFDRTWWTNGGPERLTAARSEGRLPRANIDGQRIDAPAGPRRDVMELWIDGLGRQRQDLGAA